MRYYVPGRKGLFADACALWAAVAAGEFPPPAPGAFGIAWRQADVYFYIQMKKARGGEASRAQTSCNAILHEPSPAIKPSDSHAPAAASSDPFAALRAVCLTS